MDKETIRQIVREVLSQCLAQRPTQAPPLPAAKDENEKPSFSLPGGMAASSRPCHGSGKEDMAAKTLPCHPDRPWPALRPVISADDIKRLSKNGNIIELPRAAIVTPLAKDLITQKKLTVRLIDDVAEAEPETASSAPIALACDHKSAAVQEIINAAVRDRLPVQLVDLELTAAMDRVATDVRERKLQGAILLVQEPYFALCYANKLKGLRAAPAGDWKSIQRAIDTINANVFVVEYPGRGFYQLWQLVRTFVQLRTAARRPGIHEPQIEGRET